MDPAAAFACPSLCPSLGAAAELATASLLPLERWTTWAASWLHRCCSTLSVVLRCASSSRSSAMMFRRRNTSVETSATSADLLLLESLRSRPP